MLRELSFPDTARHAWLAGLTMYGWSTSDIWSVQNSEVVQCNNCARLVTASNFSGKISYRRLILDYIPLILTFLSKLLQ